MTDEGQYDSGVGGEPEVDEAQLAREQALFEIGFFEGVLEGTPGWVDVLRVLWHDYTLVGRYDDGLGVDRKLVGLCPNDAIAHYNLACSLSLVGESGEAVSELHRAVRLGYRDWRHMERDSDLANIREHPAYISLMRRLKEG